MSELGRAVSDFKERFREKHGRLPKEPRSPHDDGEPPKGDEMSTPGERLAKLEGTVTTQQWAMAIVSAVLIGAVGVLVAITLSLSGKVDALPGQISGDIQQIVSTLSEAITASRAAEGQPNVIVVPVPGDGAAQAIPQNFVPLTSEGSTSPTEPERATTASRGAEDAE